jgi:membrane-associated phospholipid phosphatase
MAFFDMMSHLVGTYAPFAMATLSVGLLRAKPNYLYFFALGLVANTVLNIALKGAIKQPRPNTGNYHGVVRSDIYGMPSGHAQSIAFMASYVWCVLRSYEWAWIYAVALFATAIDRCHRNFHTPFQLIAGSAVGLCVGIFFWFIVHRCIKGKLVSGARHIPSRVFGNFL